MSCLVFTSCDKKKDSGGVLLKATDSISASNDYSKKILVSWKEVAGATSYSVYRRLEYYSFPDTNYVKIKEVSLTSYSDTTAEVGTYYEYTVKAISGGIEGLRSASATGHRTTETTAKETFDDLATETGGYVYNAAVADSVPVAIKEIIKERLKAGADLVFLVDNTGSMGDDIASIQEQLSEIIKVLPSNTQVGIATYQDRDSEGDYWYIWHNLTTNMDSVKTWIDAMFAGYGGDFPESVYDGIWNTVNNMTWRTSSTKVIIVIGDAPALEDPSRTTYSQAQVIAKCKEAGILVNLYPILIGYSSYYKSASAKWGRPNKK